jgi:hypothetical protein
MFTKFLGTSAGFAIELKCALSARSPFALAERLVAFCELVWLFSQYLIGGLDLAIWYDARIQRGGVAGTATCSHNLCDSGLSS